MKDTIKLFLKKNRWQQFSKSKLKSNNFSTGIGTIQFIFENDKIIQIRDSRTEPTLKDGQDYFFLRAGMYNRIVLKTRAINYFLDKNYGKRQGKDLMKLMVEK